MSRLHYSLLRAIVCCTAFLSLANGAALKPTMMNSLNRRQESWKTWCGAVRYDPTGAQVKTVEGTWAVPEVSVPAGATDAEDYWLYHWVGVDGSYGCNTILQGGTSVDIYKDKVRAKLWWQFYPDNIVYIDDMALDEGDEVYVKVTGVTKTSGVVLVKNHTKGTERTIIANLESDGGLCFHSAAWVVEAPHTSTFTWPLAEFTAGTISGAVATQFDDATFGLDGAAIGDMVQDGRTLCQARQMSDSAVKVGTTL